MAEIKGDRPNDGDTVHEERDETSAAPAARPSGPPPDNEAPEPAPTAAEQRATRAEERERAAAIRKEERAADRERARATRAKTVRWATSIVSIGSAVFAVILALYIVFVVFDANDGNPLVSMVGNLANSLVVFFRDMFTPEDHRVGVLVNYGLAAIFWLIVGRILIALLRRIR